MNLDSPVLFEQRYELRNRLWLDGPHAGWLAFDRLLGREVVFNMPYRPADDQRFLQAARIRSRLRHANLIPLYDVGATKDGRPFFTGPYIKATDIQRLQRDREGKASDVTLARLVSYLLDVCKAVAYLHANGFFHLELHPFNVLVAPQFQEVFVIRGLPSMPPVSLDMEGKNSGLRGGMCLGAPAYMAPEQADPERRSGPPDALTDIYGLGGILFEILYGKPPNAGLPATIAKKVTALAARKGPPRQGTLGTRAARCRELARKLEPVCLRALESDRTARQVSVSAFMREVEQCASGWIG
jgi:eukaryotic-like serine/threonine-protein kinase